MADNPLPALTLDPEESPMIETRIRDRLDHLFADMERLIASPVSANNAFRAELDDLRARLFTLETEVIAQREATARETAPALPEAGSVAPIHKPEIFPFSGIQVERDWVRAVFAGEDGKSLPPTPEAAPAISTPLASRGVSIGKLELQPPCDRSWTRDEQDLLDAVAQQASLQIQNLRLLADTEKARAEAEAATRRFIHNNWDTFLDAIQHSQRVGFAYDRAGVTEWTDLSRREGGVRETIHVLDEHIGALYLEPDPSRPLADEDRAMISTVASRVAQQVENIRLLADASRARAEAEEATRRLTREGWQGYASRKTGSGLGFAYDSNMVKPFDGALPVSELSLDLPLRVRGETIGALAVAGGRQMTSEAADLAVAIAEQVSVHLETLRLTEELQKRAAELQTVAKVGTTASTVLNPDELLQSVVDLTKERFDLYHAHVYLADDAWSLLLLAAGSGEVGRQMVEAGWNIPLDHTSSIVAEAARKRSPIIANDVHHDAESGFLSNQLLPDTRSEMAVPMIVGEKVIGVFDVQAVTVGRFTEEDANIYTTLASQVGVSLQNARLYAEQTATVAQLRELDRLKSAFLANMSHELRTPLNSILGFSDVMLEGLDGPISEYMDNDLKLIQKNGKHLLHLINDVLDMAKIDAGRMNLHPEKFHLRDLFAEVLGITSSLALEKSLALTVEEDSSQSVEVFADLTRIQQVMINLVNNAIKFTEKGGVTIHASQPQNGHVLIRVRDTGMGIPADHLEGIFQEFTQVDTSTTRKVGGTGLGLPISRRLIELHGGRLWAESAGIPGEGSSFCVELPLEARITEPIEKKAK